MSLLEQPNAKDAKRTQKTQNESGTDFSHEIIGAAVEVQRELARADLIGEESVIVELRAGSLAVDAHRAQLLSYLRLAGLRLGLLINFHEVPLTRAIQRVVNKL